MIDVNTLFTSQYRAALKMLENAVRACPDELWDDPRHLHRFWHLAYHTAVYADFYLSPSEAEWQPWDKFRPKYQYLDDEFPHPRGADSSVVKPYTKDEILGYIEQTAAGVPARLSILDMDGPSGFDWLPFTKFELQIYNIRHIQHHAAQLISRLRDDAGLGVEWVGKG